MNVIFHRGHIGFQPFAVNAVVSYSFTEPKIESFINDGMLYIPVSEHDLDQSDLGNKGTILSAYRLSSKIYHRWLQWDERGPADHLFQKSSTDPENSLPRYRRVPLSLTHSTAAVLTWDAIDSEYLAALVHADASLEQINDFCVEFLIGSVRPFIWTQLSVVEEMIHLSKKRKSEYPFAIERFGPSKYFMRTEAERMANEIIAQFSKEGDANARPTDNI